MAELARQTAAELRKRGIWAQLALGHTGVVEVPFVRDWRLMWRAVPLSQSQFDNLGPIACADVIQAEEARRAQEWAGDEP